MSSARLKHDKKFSIISTFILSFRPSSIIFYTFHFSRSYFSPVHRRPSLISHSFTSPFFVPWIHLKFKRAERQLEEPSERETEENYEWKKKAKLKAWSVVNYVMRIKLWLKISEESIKKSPAKSSHHRRFVATTIFAFFSFSPKLLLPSVAPAARRYDEENQTIKITEMRKKSQIFRPSQT